MKKSKDLKEIFKKENFDVIKIKENFCAGLLRNASLVFMFFFLIPAVLSLVIISFTFVSRASSLGSAPALCASTAVLAAAKSAKVPATVGRFVEAGITATASAGCRVEFFNFSTVSVNQNQLTFPIIS